MARRPTRSQQRLFARLIQRLTPELAAAFEAAVAELRAGVVWADLIAALERQDVLAAIAALNIEPAAMYAYGAAKQAAYAEAGALAATTIIAPGAGVVGVRFDMMNPGAEAWISTNVWGHLSGWMQEEQLAAVRQTILTGYEVGRHPHRIATDVAGRVVNGRRTGGVIGLDAERARRLTAVTHGMQTAEGVQDLVVMRNGVPAVRYKVNRATEARIIKAWRAGEAVPAADRAISERQYSNALLKARAQQLSQDATAEAVFAGREEEWRQTLDKLGLPDDAVSKTWIHGGGPKDPRPHHVAMSGTTVQGMNTPFEFANGAALRWPHDPDGPVSETTLCTCGCNFGLDHTRGLT